jgi:hypothetical protein
MPSIEDTIHATVRLAVREEMGALREALEQTRPAARGELASVAKASEVADVCPDTLRRWIRKGLLRRYGRGRVVRVRLAELERMLSAGGTEASNDVSPEDAAEAILNRKRKP